GQKQPFFHAMLPTLVAVMGDAYPELPARREFVEATLLKEEHRFSETLENGMRLLESVFEDDSHQRIVPGRVAFTLYDTYGFPADLTADVARERGWGVDMAGFDAAMAEQRERARSASQFDSKVTLPADL